jgi:hypothetical protein
MIFKIADASNPAGFVSVPPLLFPLRRYFSNIDVAGPFLYLLRYKSNGKKGSLYSYWYQTDDQQSYLISQLNIFIVRFTQLFFTPFFSDAD